jgi:hypothetical protein
MDHVWVPLVWDQVSVLVLHDHSSVPAAVAEVPPESTPGDIAVMDETAKPSPARSLPQRQGQMVYGVPESSAVPWQTAHARIQSLTACGSDPTALHSLTVVHSGVEAMAVASAAAPRQLQTVRPE